MKKINYGEKVIKEIIDYLDAQPFIYERMPQEIRVQVAKSKHATLFSTLSKITGTSKYQVQEELPELLIVVFNGSV